jgi:hypothetical protein
MECKRGRFLTGIDFQPIKKRAYTIKIEWAHNFINSEEEKRNYLYITLFLCYKK